MIRVLTPQQMRAADTRACEAIGETALMRTAGKRIAEICATCARGSRVAALAGPGNNGGDAFAALAEMPVSSERVVFARTGGALSPARRDAERRARETGVRVAQLPESPDGAREALRGFDLVLDGLFGTGARLPLDDAFVPSIDAANEAGATVVAIDIPSGIDALTGAVGANAIRASVTIALAALKPGLLLSPARDCVGELWCADIGIDDSILAAEHRTFAALDAAEFLHLLPQRSYDADKRGAGAPLVVAGSAQFPGAAVLCARGAARSGAGYVTVATSAAAASALRAHLIEQVVVTIGDEGSPGAAADDLLAIARRASSVAIGPGLGLDDRTGTIVREFCRRLDLPFVADASALFHFAKHLDILRGKRCVITPHAGEFARLAGGTIPLPAERVERLRAFVERTGITTLLKGPTTLVYDGTTMHLNAPGTSALATAGTGDVLTGIIGTLLGQGLAPVDAARAGAYWHALAGDRCAAQRRVGVVAGDLPETLAAALPESSAGGPLVRVR